MARYTYPSRQLVEPLCSIRIDLQQNSILLTLSDQLGLSPSNLPGSEVKRVVGLGTCTDICAIDFGDEHPEAKVKGRILEVKKLMSFWLTSGKT